MTWCHEKKIWGTSNYSCLLWDMQQGDVVPLANFLQDPLHNLSHLFFLAHMISLIRSSYATRFPLQPMLEKCEKNQDLWYCLPLSIALHSPPTVQGWPVESRFFLKHPASAIHHFEGGTCLLTCIYLDWNKMYTACHVPNLQFANTEIYWNTTTSHSNMGQNLPLTGIIVSLGNPYWQVPILLPCHTMVSWFLQKTM